MNLGTKQKAEEEKRNEKMQAKSLTYLLIMLVSRVDN
jgi:hypothetical protein